MKIFSKLIFCLAFAFLAGCASTHGNFISEHRDAWIDGYSAKSNHADRGLLFCRANVKDDGLADPVCYEARFEEYEEEKERVLEIKKKEEKLKKKESLTNKDSNKESKDSQ